MEGIANYNNTWKITNTIVTKRKQNIRYLDKDNCLPEIKYITSNRAMANRSDTFYGLIVTTTIQNNDNVHII